jgi:hypothetical protein
MRSTDELDAIDNPISPAAAQNVQPVNYATVLHRAGASVHYGLASTQQEKHRASDQVIWLDLDLRRVH